MNNFFNICLQSDLELGSLPIPSLASLALLPLRLRLRESAWRRVTSERLVPVSELIWWGQPHEPGAWP